MDTRPMIFIVGVGRSGTSLLQSMLHAHPRICFLPETAFIRRFLASGLAAKTLAEGGVDGLTDLLVRDERMGRLNLDADTLHALVARHQDGLADLYPALAARFAAAQGDVAYLGDKDPRNAEYLPWIAAHYPNARVVHIYRDPRDVLASKKKAAWSAGRSLFYHSFAGRVQFGMAERWGAPFGPRYTALAYERLTAAPREVLTGLCRFLDLPYDAAMEQFGEAGRALVAADEMAWKKETLGPLLQANSGKWRSALTPWETAVTERLCRPVMGRGGYPVSAPRLPLSRRLLLACLPPLFAAAAVVYGGYRRWTIRF